MKPKTLIPLALAAVFASGAFAAGPPAWRTPVPASSVPATAEEQDDLTFMREEEKLARDLYMAYQEMWDWPVFGNIAASESKHFDAIGRLLTVYGLTDPAPPYPGSFQNGDLQALYDDLIAQGEGSLEAALTAGGLVEEVDIGDLDEAIADTDKPDIQRAYASLQCGSRNHLRSFALSLGTLGVAYEAQVLPQETVDAILAGPMERCRPR